MAADRHGIRPSEAQLAMWWHQGAFKSVTTTQGRSLQVLYPGRPSAQAGPDFRDSLLITEEGDLVRGDVEVHLRRGDWVGHGHHQDPRYRGVVLHLFLHGGKKETPPEDGAQMQEVSLDGRHLPDLLKARPGPRRPATHHRAAPLERLRDLPGRELGRVLDEAGERRFRAKALGVMERLRRGDAEEEVYAGLMEALGYSQNRLPMSLLARGLPLRRVKEMVGPQVDRYPLALEAIFLGAAGLLPHQRGISLPGPEEERRSGELAYIWQHTGAPSAVPRGMWSAFRVRPPNQPTRRLVGASFLIGKYWHIGLAEGLEAGLGGGLGAVERALEVASTGFWARHLDYHRPAARAPALVGKGRARDMVINVVLPFLFGRAHLLGDGELGRRALSLYRSCPPAQDNEVTREIEEILLASREKRQMVNTARRQQGLIHLYHVLRGEAR